MTPHISSFLKAVLGADAAAALKKAADRSDSLGSVLPARTIVGWLGLASRWGYEGDIPGLPGSYFRFAKSEDGFEGEVRMGKNQYEFKGVDLPHVAAGLSVALGVDRAPDEGLRDAELVALGQNIDLLLKTQVIKGEEESKDGETHDFHTKSPPGSPGAGCSQCGERRAHANHTQEPWTEEEEAVHRSVDLEKAGGTTAPGAAATQKPPAGPVDGGFTAPRAKQPTRNKKKFGARLNMSQTSSKCSVCGSAQFAGDVFVGCFCLKDLAKHAQATAVDGGFFVEMDPAFWSREDAALLLDIVGEGA